MHEETIRSHQYKMRVYYEDTDAGGIVYYANYLRFAERARAELMRDLGVESSKLMRDDGVVLAVRRCNVDYINSAVLDDSLLVETALQRVGGASIEVLQTVHRFDEELVSMKVKLGCMSLKGRATRLPILVRKKLTKYLNSN